MRRSLMALIAGAACAFAAASADAYLITQWGYTATSTFVTSGGGAPTFTGNSGCQSVAATAISWGDSPCGPPTAGSGRSGLEIDNSAGSGSVSTNGPAGTTDAFIHHNNVVGTDTLLSATIQATLTLTPQVPAGPVFAPISHTFLIHFAETPNAAPCAVPSPIECNDIFVLDNSALNFPVVVPGDATYFISFFAAPALAALPNGGCAAAGVASPCFGFTTIEGQDNRVLFALQITSAPIALVPEPATLALLGIGFGALAVRRRNRA